MTEDQHARVADAVFNKARSSIVNRVEARGGTKADEKAVAKLVAEMLTAAKK